MFHDLALIVTPFMEKYGMVGVFLASIFEEIVAPIPSSVVVLSAGFFITQGMPPATAAMTILIKVMVPASLGITIGSLFPYAVARIGEEVAIRKFGWLLGVKPDSLKMAEKWFTKHSSDELLLFLVRAVPIIPSVIIGLFCGAIRMPVKQFVIYTFLGSLPRTFVLGMAGWSTGQAYLQYADHISQLEDYVLYVIAAVLIIGAGIWAVKLMQRKKRSA